jgi:uncharacterized membrane protein
MIIGISVGVLVIAIVGVILLLKCGHRGKSLSSHMKEASPNEFTTVAEVTVSFEGMTTPQFLDTTAVDLGIDSLPFGGTFAQVFQDNWEGDSLGPAALRWL